MHEAIRAGAANLAREAAVAMYAHRSAAEAWAWARYGLGVPAAVLAGLAGYFALGEDNLGWGGLLALVAAALSLLMTALKPADEVVKHHLASTRFGDVRRRGEMLAARASEPTTNEGELAAALSALQEDFTTAEREAPNQTRRRRARAAAFVAAGADETKPGRLAEIIGRIVATAVVALAAALVLMLANWFVRKVIDHEIPGGLWGGLVFALFVYGAAFAGFWALTHRRIRAILTGALAASVVLFLVPLAIVTRSDRGEPVAVAGPVPSRLDVVLIVSEATFPPDEAEIPPRLASQRWDVRYSVGARIGATIVWRLVGSSDRSAALRAAAGGSSQDESVPEFRADADPIVLLIPDPIPPAILADNDTPASPEDKDEAAAWTQSLGRSGLRTAPTFALLAGGSTARVRRWNRALRPTGGEALVLADLAVQAVTDAAELAATEAPTSSGDLALALRHRPYLYFDTGEGVREWPLDIDSFFASGRVTLCEATVGGAKCDERPTTDPAALRNGATFLRIRVQRPQIPGLTPGPDAGATEGPTEDPAVGPESSPPPPPGPPPGQTGSAYYVHIVHAPEQSRIYLDYWWYLPYNPTPVLSGALCGPGFTLAGLTCFDHQSDWEGIVVALDTTTSPPSPVAVEYAQHESVVAYGWEYLTSQWHLDAEDQHPRVYVARNSHASYPFKCVRTCRQTIAPIPEAYDGGKPWPLNDDNLCVNACLRALPTRNRGTEPALWNAFEGAWGERHCILRVFCDVGTAPRAPSQQERYKDPSAVDRFVGVPNAST